MNQLGNILLDFFTELVIESQPKSFEHIKNTLDNNYTLFNVFFKQKTSRDKFLNLTINKISKKLGFDDADKQK